LKVIKAIIIIIWELHFLRRICWAHEKSGNFVRSKITRFSWNPLIPLLHPTIYHLASDPIPRILKIEMPGVGSSSVWDSQRASWLFAKGFQCVLKSNIETGNEKPDMKTRTCFVRKPEIRINSSWLGVKRDLAIVNFTLQWNDNNCTSKHVLSMDSYKLPTIMTHAEIPPITSG